MTSFAVSCALLTFAVGYVVLVGTGLLRFGLEHYYSGYVVITLAALLSGFWGALRIGLYLNDELHDGCICAQYLGLASLTLAFLLSMCTLGMPPAIGFGHSYGWGMTYWTLVLACGNCLASGFLLGYGWQ